MKLSKIFGKKFGKNKKILFLGCILLIILGINLFRPRLTESITPWYSIQFDATQSDVVDLTNSQIVISNEFKDGDIVKYTQARRRGADVANGVFQSISGLNYDNSYIIIEASNGGSFRLSTQSNPNVGLSFEEVGNSTADVFTLVGGPRVNLANDALGERWTCAPPSPGHCEKSDPQLDDEVWLQGYDSSAQCQRYCGKEFAPVNMHDHNMSNDRLIAGNPGSGDAFDHEHLITGGLLDSVDALQQPRPGVHIAAGRIHNSTVPTSQIPEHTHAVNANSRAYESYQAALAPFSYPVSPHD